MKNAKNSITFYLLHVGYCHTESKGKFGSGPDNLEWKPPKDDLVRNQTEEPGSHSGLSPGKLLPILVN